MWASWAASSASRNSSAAQSRSSMLLPSRQPLRQVTVLLGFGHRLARQLRRLALRLFMKLPLDAGDLIAVALKSSDRRRQCREQLLTALLEEAIDHPASFQEG